ncbi:HGL237Wp [Eremothecium sinecaudum]|uniref:HGL237Wp n=1 Tax=Eremothecium sinecaudum TaxID=45286 RepID=A0A0X8HVC9_9SACH|nr:HGL237Wp [Eremothecium sinecaudum]AMD22103.1 HGL237Wp [Eremothecium sinecaudum]
MFQTLARVFRPKSKEQVISKYTKNLASITSRIHDLEVRLKNNDSLYDAWNKRLNFYGISFLVLVVTVVHAKEKNMALTMMAIVGSILLILGLKKMFAALIDYRRSRISGKLDIARAAHQETLEELKKETNFYSTNSLIQRFSSGESQSEDALLLMDEELSSKYKELNNLKNELAQLKEQANGMVTSDTQEVTDKWFDKVLGVLSGGDVPSSLSIVPIKCQKCGYHAGCYISPNWAWKYVCPMCAFYQENKQPSASVVERQSSANSEGEHKSTRSERSLGSQKSLGSQRSTEPPVSSEKEKEL